MGRYAGLLIPDVEHQWGGRGSLWLLPQVPLPCFFMVARKESWGTHEATRFLWSLAHVNDGIPGLQEGGDYIPSYTELESGC